VFLLHFWEFQFFFAMLPLLERNGFIAFDPQAANQPLIKTKRPNVSQNVDAHHHHNSSCAFQQQVISSNNIRYLS
jgi:hypothetical protein